MNSVWVVLAVSMTIASGEASVGECYEPGDVRTEAADVWLVSTRDLPCEACPENSPPEFRRLSADGQWIEADQQAFLRSDPVTVPTVFLVHGNRYTAEEAVEYGLDFREELECLAPGSRFRFVIWSWPSERISRRNRPDLVVKHVRSRHESVYVARLIDRMPPQSPVSLVGFSYGAQTIVGACRLLAGGEFADCRLDRRGPPRRAPLSAVLVAPAIEDSALDDVDAGRSPLSPLTRLLVTCNGRDFVLGLYPRLYGGRGPAALGRVGPACLDPGDVNFGKVETIDVADAVGRRHRWDDYRQAAPLRARLAFYTLLSDIEPTSPADADGE